MVSLIGPTPEMIDRMGDKASAKATMKAAGVPVYRALMVCWNHMSNVKSCRGNGIPVMLKATAGGGGKGMRAGRKRSKKPGTVLARKLLRPLVTMACIWKNS